MFQEPTNLFTAVIVLDKTNRKIQEATEVQEMTEVQDIQEMTEVQDIQEMTEVQDHLQEENHVKIVLVPENQEMTSF